MLSCLAAGLVAGGHHVITPLSKPLVSAMHRVNPTIECRSLPTLGLSDSADPRALYETAIEAWVQSANDADVSILIAPELDGLLESLTRDLNQNGVLLLNCSAEFLHNAVDKWATACCLWQSKVPHPPTLRARDLNWHKLNQIQRHFGNGEWVCKPSDGAGCEHLVVTRNLQDWHNSCSHRERFIIQPLVRGSAYSCSAVVDASGKWHWMPVATQQIERVGSHLTRPPSAPQNELPVESLRYVGGQLAEQSIQDRRPDELLRQIPTALGTGARGWVGVDLIFDPENEKWTVIEVNPRCTSSLLFLAEQYDGNLALDCFQMAYGISFEWSNPWKHQRFG